MPLDDLDISNQIKKNPTQQKFYKSGVILISLGILASLVLWISFPEGDESAFKNPFVYLPIIIGLLPLCCSAIYSFFKNSIKEPLKNGWGKIHFYFTIIPLYFIQLIGIVYFHHLYMSGVNPFVGSFSLISFLCLIIIIGQIFFLANIFRSLKLSYYQNADYHPTHILFLFSAFFFILKSGGSYFFRGMNSAWDLQIHDTYFVISFVYINLFFVLLFLLFAGLYYFLNTKLKKTLHPFLSKIHFYLMVLSVLYFLLFLIGYDNSVRRYYSSAEAILQYQEFVSIQWQTIMVSFLFAQVFFLINFLRSVLISIFRKK
jgi:heme/copper-type cytochrome/quinol oxidase subunit 1